MYECKVLCTAACIHNDGKHYYNVCHNEHMNHISSSGGIDRKYVEGCRFKEISKKEDEEHG